jgi:hypothetical protein
MYITEQLQRRARDRIQKSAKRLFERYPQFELYLRADSVRVRRELEDELWSLDQEFRTFRTLQSLLHESESARRQLQVY